MRQLRLSRDERRAAILNAAVTYANTHGLAACDFRTVAECVAVPTTERNIRYHFGRKRELWRAIAKHKQAAPSTVKAAKQLELL